MIIELDSVELYFKKRCILNGIYLKGETGKITALLGRNGCGKSCLLRILFGSLKPKYKFIKIDDKAVLFPLYLQKNIAYLPQHNLVPDHFKVKTLFRILNLNWKEFLSHFKEFSTYYNFKLNQISGGERRVIETYVVLKQEGDITLLDEPFSNIAPLYVEKIKKLIVTEKTCKAIIMTDHYFRDVVDICDDLYLLKNGCTQKINQLEDLEDYNYLNVGALK